MLTHIHIWNFAIVEALDLPFSSGLSVMTGETGAGKSILLDALGLALGDRADNDLVRHGSEKAEISVTFDTRDAAEAEAWLQEHEMASENECIIRRIINTSGPSKAFINGIPATVQLLRELGEMLVDLHGQHEHQSLMKREVQRQLLDDFGHHADLLHKVSDTYQEWRALQTRYDKLSQASKDRDARLELLRFQVKELRALNLHEGETEQLEQEHKRLANASKLIGTSEQVLQMLEEGEQTSILDQLNLCAQSLNGLVSTDNALQGIGEMLNTALIQVQEASSELRHHLDSLDLNPDRLAEVEDRLGELHDLSRKHRMAATELHQLLPVLETELTELEEADVQLDKIQTAIKSASENYLKHASELSKRRVAAAKKLSKAVTTAMQELSMEGGRFEVSLIPLDTNEYSLNGLEGVEFEVSANPGQPLKSLVKVASGGELSRISLAIQVMTAQQARIPTLIFDEVDVGIGGRVAEIVGRKLNDLGNHRQVICVTHLPQVAALGHYHLQVSKQISKGSTTTGIQTLSPDERVQEVARMLGGVQITQQTLAHAREMLAQAGA